MTNAGQIVERGEEKRSGVQVITGLSNEIITFLP